MKSDKRLFLAPQQFNNYPPSALMVGSKDLTSFKARHSKECILYAHLPFCFERCGYCVLSSLVRSNEELKKILIEIEKELKIVVSQFGRRKIVAALYGGGTPSNLSVSQIRQFYGAIHKLLRFEHQAEVTVEVRPGTFTLGKLKAFKECGVNRLSFGVQTLTPGELKYCGRQNTYEVVAKSMNLTQKAGFDNINFDIIYGLPEQTPVSFQKTCRLIFRKLKPQHVCLYLLIIHPGTVFARLEKHRPDVFPSEKEKQEMHSVFIKESRKYGYKNTSVENVAQSPDFYSRYQRYNWEGLERLAIGPEAIGFVGCCQYQNLSYGKAYQEAVEKGRLPIKYSYKLNKDERLRRTIILGLHNLVLDLKKVDREFGMDTKKRFSKRWKYLQELGFLNMKGKVVSLSDKGIEFFYHVQSRFFSQEVKNAENMNKSYKEKAD